MADTLDGLKGFFGENWLALELFEEATAAA
jgi:hypothetical protein